MSLSRQDTQIEMSFFGKRFVEADRVVLIWCTTSDSQGYALVNRDERVRVRECGWTVMKAADDGTADQGQRQPGSTIASVARLTPELERSGVTSGTSNDTVGLLTDVVLSMYHQNLTVLREMIGSTVVSGDVTGTFST